MRKRTVGLLTLVVTGVALLASLDRQRLAVGDHVHRQAHGGSGNPEARRCARGVDRDVQGNADREQARMDAHVLAPERGRHGSPHPCRQEGRGGERARPALPDGDVAACKSPIKGSATLKAAQIKSLNAGGLYVNMHTKKNAGGEIRGQIGK